MTLVIEPMFTWSAKVHGTTDPWWIWVEDPENEHIYHIELCVVLIPSINPISTCIDLRTSNLLFTPVCT